MIKEIHPRDLPAAQLIEALGDIAIKGVNEDKNNISKKCIDNLIEIAIEFLELKSNDELLYKVESDPTYSRQGSPNQYVKYVLNELNRIFYIALKKENEEIKRHLILHLSKILGKAIKGENNWNIIEILYETKEYRGSLYWKLMKQSLEKGKELDKNFLTQHLVSVPQFAILEQKFNQDYLEQFITYHIFRIAQMIIDENEYTLFENLIDGFSHTLTFKDPIDISNDIVYELYPHNYGLSDKEFQDRFTELNFLITHQCIKDLSKIQDFRKKLDEYRKLIIQKQSKQEQIEKINDKFIKINNKINEFFICSKLYGTFFRIGSYLVSKGIDYKKYIEKLWYYQKDSDERTSYINSTPISNSIEWNTLYVTYSGMGSSIYDIIEPFDDFNYSKYSYEYYALLLLKNNEIMSFPSKEEIVQWNQKNEEYKSRYFYEYVSTLNIDKIQNAFDEIIKNKKEFLSIIDPDQLKIKKRISEIKNKLIELKSMKKNTVENVVLSSKLNNQKLVEFKQNYIIGTYKNHSKIDKIATSHHDENLLESSCKIIHSDLAMPRDAFIEQGIISHFFTEGGISILAANEIFEIYAKIKQGIKSTIEDTDDFLNQIQSATQKLKKSGFNPNIIFIPLNVETELMKKQHVMFYPNNLLKIDEETNLYMINSWKHFDFTDIIIYDSSQLSVTYKAIDFSDRLKIDVLDTEEGNEHVTFSSKICLSTKIDKKEGYVRIVNKNVPKLDPKNPDI